MTRELTSDADHEERLNDVLLAYVEELEAGRMPDRRQLLLAHPDLRDDLECFFNDRDEIDRLAAPLRAASSKGDYRETTQHDAVLGLDLIHEAARDGSSTDPSGVIGQLGDFRILREVGRGGMGVVYEAYQISLQRRVALKVLPFASAIDQRQLQRFKNEALAAAHLQHTNIVPVHAVGSERGVHYYAMQFIDGQSLAELIGDLRRADANTSNGSLQLSQTHVDETANLTSASPRTRPGARQTHFEWVARLGRQAALALEYAHETGIVHRDIKPSNLLLDPQAQVWVTDFGLAQVRSETVRGEPGLTATGEVLGTLRYASPEQAMARRGIVDHRSDIYSLGATLYELLTLRPVFEGRDRGELLRQISDDDPLPLRQVDARIPEDLETVILKSLRKEPGERYATAEEFAADLQRFLDHRPILARRPTFVERMRKFGRRHPSVIASSIVVLILLALGSMTSAALIRIEQARTSVAQDAAETAYRRERQRAEEAESRFRLARRSVDELIEFSEEELAHRPGMDSLRRRLLRSALAYYEEFVAQRHDDPHARAELVDTKKRIEGILSDLAVLRASRRMYLLAQPSVLDDICQDAEQRVEIQELAGRIGKRWMDSLRDFRRLSLTERDIRTLERARADEAEVNQVLNPTQQRRVRQIALQLEGIGIFQESDVVAALELTRHQRARIREIEERAAFERRWKPPSKSGTPSQSGPPKPPRPTPMAQILELLSEAQRRQWNELIGKPFKGKVPSFAPFSRPTTPRGPST